MKKFALLALTSLLLFTGCGKKEETVLKSEYDALRDFAKIKVIIFN